MNTDFSVTLAKIIKETGLKEFYMPSDPEELMVSSMEINRPGLELTGYMDYFDKARIIIFGNTEYSYLEQFATEKQYEILSKMFCQKPPAIIIARNHQPSEAIIKATKEYEVPILISPDATSSMSASLITFLNAELAPRITRHGVLVEVYGEGILLIGHSGVGKSETAIELMLTMLLRFVEFQIVPLLVHLPKISVTLSSFVVSVLSMPAVFSVWVPLSLQKKSIWLSIWNSGIVKRHMTVSVWIISIPRLWVSVFLL